MIADVSAFILIRLTDQAAANGVTSVKTPFVQQVTYEFLSKFNAYDPSHDIFHGLEGAFLSFSA